MPRPTGTNSDFGITVFCPTLIIRSMCLCAPSKKDGGGSQPEQSPRQSAGIPTTQRHAHQPQTQGIQVLHEYRILPAAGMTKASSMLMPGMSTLNRSGSPSRVVGMAHLPNPVSSCRCRNPRRHLDCPNIKTRNLPESLPAEMPHASSRHRTHIEAAGVDDDAVYPIELTGAPAAAWHEGV